MTYMAARTASSTPRATRAVILLAVKPSPVPTSPGTASSSVRIGRFRGSGLCIISQDGYTGTEVTSPTANGTVTYRANFPSRSLNHLL
jgi:hypothetical protein